MPKYIVRYGAMRLMGVFSISQGVCDRGVSVIARTNRGLEAGEVLCEATKEAIGAIRNPVEGKILRRMTNEDINEGGRIHKQEEEEFRVCLRCIAELELDMHLVDVEHVFGGERIVVYYLAEGRVDFRELVKVLAGEFQTRIEMRQIGVRDEAKLMADYGDCGKPVCCNNHLAWMPPVSMKMAKLQKATLDPTKISGRCGRLKCCLRYEYETYQVMQKDLPSIGESVNTPDGRGRVLAHEILAGKLLVELEGRVRKLVDAADVSVVSKSLPDESPSRAKPEDKSKGQPTGKPTGKPAAKSQKSRNTRKRKPS